MTLVCEQCKIDKVVNHERKLTMGVMPDKQAGKCPVCGKQTNELHFYKETGK